MAVSTQIQVRRGTAAAWTAANPTLAAGEVGYETDTGKFKFGDGLTAWATLPYSSASLQQADYDAVMPWTIEKTPVGVNDAAVRIGNWGLAAEAADLFAFAMINSTPAQNDEIGWDFPMAAGTWNFDVTFIQFAAGAIMTVNLDGVAIGTFDTYNSVSLANHHGTLTGFTVATNGKHRVSMKAATKNASSTAYELLVCGFQLRRTA